MTRKFTNLLLVLALALLTSSGWAGDYEDGISAYEKKDYVTALKKFKIGASQGNADAQVYIGLMNDLGRGVTQNYAEAMRWYKLAAAQGDAGAQVYIGLLYRTGRGVGQDYAEAMRWFELAAAQGNTDAQFNIGKMYQSGNGVAQNLVRAHMWSNLSALNGDADSVKLRDAVAAKMTPQQIVEAQKMASECQARDFKNCD